MRKWTVSDGRVFSKINRPTGERTLVVWSPKECEDLKSLLARLKRLEDEFLD